MGGSGSSTDAANNGCTSRKFVAGEKFRVSGIALQKDGILVSAFGDPYNNVRYYGEVKFPFAKGSVPPVDDFVKTVSEVFTVQPADNTGDQSGQSSQGDQGGQPAADTTAAPAAAPMQGTGGLPQASPSAQAPPTQSAYAAIAPPPDPTDATAVQQQDQQANQVEQQATADASQGDATPAAAPDASAAPAAQPAPN